MNIRLLKAAAMVAAMLYFTPITAQTAVHESPKRFSSDVAYVQFAMPCPQVENGVRVTTKALPKALEIWTILDEKVVVPALCRDALAAHQVEADYYLTIRDLSWLAKDEELVYSITDDNRHFIEEPTIMNQNKPFVFKLHKGWVLNLSLVKRN
jgi:hypothetical protein